MSHRRLLIIAMTFAIALTASSTRAADDLVPPQVGVDVTRGLSYLARQQQADGSFTGFDEPGPRVAPAAVAALAFLAAGQTPRDGRHALVVHNAIDFILRQLPGDGSFGRSDSSGAEGQAVITIALAEAYGMEDDAAQRRQIRPALHDALAAILAAQDRRPGEPRAGGWTADTEPGEGDLYSTALTVLALRALADAGLDVPRDALDRAAAYARSCLPKDRPGQFADRGKGPIATTVAAGALILMLTDPDPRQRSKPTADHVDAAMRFLAAHKVEENAPDYYASLYLVALSASRANADAWAKAWPGTRDALIAQHKPTDDGSWFPPQSQGSGLGAVSATATATLALSVPYRLLPLHRN